MRFIKNLRKGISVGHRIFYACGALTLLVIGLVVFSFFSPIKKTLAPSDIKGVVSPDTLSALQKDRQKLAEVKAIVAQRNAESAKEHKKFRDAGWQFVQEQPPNVKVIGLDPNALSEFEEEFQLHIQTNTFSGALLNNLQEIILKTKNPKTRYVAIDALGRAVDAKAQLILISLFDKLSDPEHQQQVLQLLKPSSESDPVSAFLFEKMGASEISNGLKQQAAFAVAVHYLFTNRDNTSGEPPEALMSRVPSDFRQEFRSIFKSVQNGNSKH